MHVRDRVERIRTKVGRSTRVQVLVTIFCAFAVIGVGTEQGNATRITRFGPVAESLSQREITQIADLANAAGKPVWLVLGLPSMIDGVAALDVYLQPDVATERLRRGRMLGLVAKDPPIVSERSDWTVKDTASYAYVPVEQTGQIASKDDLAWPFTVEGDLDDETLISLVTFVRSTPPLPGVSEGHFPREVPRAALRGVAHRGDQFIVGLRTSDDTGFNVWLIRKDGAWLVTKWGSSIS